MVNARGAGGGGGGGAFAPGPLLSGVGGNNDDTVSSAPVLGAMIFGNNTPLWDALAGNITTTKQFLTQTGTGAVSAGPNWGPIVIGDLPVEVITKQLSWAFPNPAAGSYFYIEIPWDLDMTVVQASTDAGTVDVQIRECATVGAAGSDVLTAVLTADDTGASTAAFDIATLTQGRFLQVDLSNVTGAPTQLTINLQGTLA